MGRTILLLCFVILAGLQVAIPTFVKASPSAFDHLMSKVAGRPQKAIVTYKIGSDGNFEAEPSKVIAAVRSELLYTGMKPEPDDCAEQNADASQPSYLRCWIEYKLATLTADQPSATKATNRIEVVYTTDVNERRTLYLFDIALLVDAVARVIDPDLNDGQRATVFGEIGRSYFANNRAKGVAFSHKIKYVFTEEGGDLTVTITPATANDVRRDIPSSPIHPVIALADGLNRDDLMKPDPLDAPEIQSVISEKRILARKLLGQLDQFRYEPRFHAVGFMENQPYRAWLQSLRPLQTKETDTEPMRLANIRAGSYLAAFRLYEMASEYMHNKGRETKDSIRARHDVVKFLDGP